MSWVNSDYTPPVGFYFAVQVLNQNAKPYPPADAAFQEVSGISVSLATESINEGGQNQFAHKVPGRATYSDLVLKRGLLVRSSALAAWCDRTFRNDKEQKVEPSIIKVTLLDANSAGKGALVSWVFTNAYPIKWDISPFGSQKSEIVVESITFTYSYFEKKYEPAAKGYPYLPPQLKKKAAK